MTFHNFSSFYVCPEHAFLAPTSAVVVASRVVDSRQLDSRSPCTGWIFVSCALAVASEEAVYTAEMP